MLNSDHGIELLVDTVKEGKMDPWDLDIIEVTDKYLEKIDTMDHRNLTVSGRLFFYASVLLRLKAEYTAKGFLQLTRPPEEEVIEELHAYEMDVEPLFGDDYTAEAEEGEQLHLPGMIMVPRPAPVRKRGLSLQDLISALQRCEDLEKRRQRSRKVAAREAALHKKVVETAHGDDLGGDITRVRNKVGLWPDETKDRVPFQELLCDHLSPTTAYMALLFLASNSEVELHQRRFYRDLSVSRGRGFQHELSAE